MNTGGFNITLSTDMIGGSKPALVISCLGIFEGEEISVSDRRPDLFCGVAGFSCVFCAITGGANITLSSDMIGGTKPALVISCLAIFEGEEISVSDRRPAFFFGVAGFSDDFFVKTGGFNITLSADMIGGAKPAAADPELLFSLVCRSK